MAYKLAGSGQSDGVKGQGVVSVGGTSAQIVAANADRVEVTIVNDHATQVVYLGFGQAAVLNSGIRLNAAGGSYTTSGFSGAIHAIATGATTAVGFLEV